MKLLTTALALIALVPAATAVTLDFEDLTGSGAVPSTYAGLDWSSGWRHYTTPESPYLASSGSSRVFNEFGQLGVVRFLEDVLLESVWIAGYGSGQFIEGFDNGVKVFESVHMPTGNATFGLVLTLNWSGVDEIRIQSGGWGYGNYVLDDLSFVATQSGPNHGLGPRMDRVPDAGSPLGLLSAGLGVVMGWTTRRRTGSSGPSTGR